MVKMIETHASLFSGFGGFDLGARWAGIKTIWQLENNKYCQKVLEKNFPDVPNRYWMDVQFYIKTFMEKNNEEKIDIFTAGPPCQPISQSGKRRGKKDHRFLWEETLTIVKHLNPRWVILETPPFIQHMGEQKRIIRVESYPSYGKPGEVALVSEEQMYLQEIIDKLGSIGYKVPTLCNQEPVIVEVPVAGLGAPHWRYRLFICAHSDLIRLEEGDVEIPPSGKINKKCQKKRKEETKNFGRAKHPPWERWSLASWMERECAHGVSSRVERDKGIGNAVVPQVAYVLFETIKMVDEMCVEVKK